MWAGRVFCCGKALFRKKKSEKKKSEKKSFFLKLGENFFFLSFFENFQKAFLPTDFGSFWSLFFLALAFGLAEEPRPLTWLDHRDGEESTQKNFSPSIE